MSKKGQPRSFRTEDDENVNRKATHVRESLSHRFQEFLLKNETFGRLHSLQVKVTFHKARLQSFFVDSRAGLEFSQWRCSLSSSSVNAISANNSGKQRLFDMMQTIAAQMDSETSAFTFTDSQPKALDLCMAPGGFLAYFFHKSPAGVADAITLPEEEGGHQVLLSLDGRKAQINVVFADVTMYAAELGVESIPKNHPEAHRLLALWPHPKCSYDLLICDGQALRTQNVPEYRKLCEQSRLFNSQLLIALQKVRVGGTIIALLHKAHKWRTFALLRQFSKFSDIVVFKPKKFHAEKSSFYMVAKNVRSQSREATDAIESFR